MRTQLLYLEDSYQKEMDAQILEVLPDGDKKYKILLDQTVFYAMGGGQPTDQGKLTSDSWSADVYQVLMKDGELWHFVNAETAPTVGTSIHGVIDWDRRYKNMKVHTGGHIVDFALYVLGYSPNQLTPLKGDHGKKPFIVYQGVLEKDIKQELQDKVNELISKDLKFTTYFQSYEDLQKETIYLQPGLPTNKPLRTLHLDTVGSVADGGTQLHSTGEVGKVSVDEMVVEGDTTTIHYSILS